MISGEMQKAEREAVHARKIADALRQEEELHGKKKKRELRAALAASERSSRRTVSS